MRWLFIEPGVSRDLLISYVKLVSYTKQVNSEFSDATRLINRYDRK